MGDDLPITFERNLYQAVIRFKQLHPGVLEDRTRQRRSEEEKDNGDDARSDRTEVLETDRPSQSRHKRTKRSDLAVQM